MREEFVGVLLMLAAALGVAVLWQLGARVLAPRRRAGDTPAASPQADDSVERVPAKSFSISVFALLLQLTLLLAAPWAVTAAEWSASGRVGMALFVAPVAIGWFHAQRKGLFRW